MLWIQDLLGRFPFLTKGLHVLLLAKCGWLLSKTMGCTVSKSTVEPRTVTIKLSGCRNVSRSWSSPVQVTDGAHHIASNPLNHPPRTKSDHVVSLTSSTYGSLRVDSQEEERARAASKENAKTGNVSSVANHKQVETTDMWELMQGIEEENAALEVLRGLMGKQKKGSGSGEESGKRSPRVYHTLEDVDTVLDVRKSLTADYRFTRGSSMDSVPDKNKSQSGVHSPMMQERRSRALQISQEVIEELDDLRRRNLSRSQEFNSQSQEFNFTGGRRSSQKFRSLSQSQEFYTAGRSTSQEFSSRARRNLSESQDLDSVRRINLTGNQDHDSRWIGNLSRSQEFVSPPEDDDGVTTRHGSEVLRNVSMKDERRNALSKPDVVLRSPMLRVLSGKERSLSSNNAERREKPLMLLQGQAQPVASEWKAALPRSAAGSTKVSLTLSSPERRSGKKLEPRVASAVAALSRLGDQRAASSLARSASQREGEVFQDHASKMNYYSASKTPANTSVGTVAENMPFIAVSRDQKQDGRKLSTVKKQSSEYRSYSMSTTTTGPMISSNSESSFRDREPESLLDDDPISLDYELVTKAEVAEAVLRSGSSQPRQSEDTKNNRHKRSERRDSPPLDPELLASFEEALEMFIADDWCAVRIGESDDAAVSSTTSDADSPSWHMRENQFEILENHVPQAKKVGSSKIKLLVVEDRWKPSPLDRFEKKCPPGGEARCVLYTTSLRGIRKTFEDCSHTRRMLQYCNVQIDERDIAMHGEFRQEVTDLVGKAAPVPRLFVRGRYIGGAEEVAHLVEEGALSALLEDLPRQEPHAVCDGCGDARFVPCFTCYGSCKVVADDGTVASCQDCNENGLCRCPLCF